MASATLTIVWAIFCPQAFSTSDNVRADHAKVQFKFDYYCRAGGLLW